MSLDFGFVAARDCKTEKKIKMHLIIVGNSR